MEKRWLIYAIPIALALAGFGVGASILLTSELVFIVIGINVSLTLDLVREQILKQRAKIRIVTNETTLVELYQLFKDKAVEECWLTWSTRYKATDLESYSAT
jgi:hypothetical protein